jgi:RimJ/RimL family protein N-acetyltransferase
MKVVSDMALKEFVQLKAPLHKGSNYIEMIEVEEKEVKSFFVDPIWLKANNEERHIFAIQLEKRTIGAAILTKDTINSKTGKLNYWMEYDYLINGFGTIVAAELIQYAIEELHLETITSDVLEPLWGNGSEPFVAI